MLYRAAAGIYELYYLILIARCILSFFPDHSEVKNNQVSFWIYRLTDPVLIPFQKLIPPIQIGMSYMDFSPIVVFLLYSWVGRIILSILASI